MSQDDKIKQIVGALRDKPGLYEGVRREMLLPEVDRLVDEQLEALSLVDLHVCQREQWENLVRYHHGYGRHLRNHYELWSEENAELVRALCLSRKDSDEIHTDSASQAIIERLWERLQGMSLEPLTPEQEAEVEQRIGGL